MFPEVHLISRYFRCKILSKWGGEVKELHHVYKTDPFECFGSCHSGQFTELVVLQPIAFLPMTHKS